MYKDDDEESSNESVSDSSSSEEQQVEVKRKRGRGRPRRVDVQKVDVQRTKDCTWSEAAEIVLSKYDHAIPQKEILRLIVKDKLRPTKTAQSSPISILNSVLNHDCKGPAATFYKSGIACFGLNKTKSKNIPKSEPEKESKSGIVKLQTYAEFKKENKTKQKLTPPTKSYTPPSRSLKTSSVDAQKYQPKKQKLIPPGAKIDRPTPTMGPISKATYDRLKQQQPQHRRMGPTTSALVRPAPPFSRPPPGAALRVMPPKKRIKLDDDEDEGGRESDKSDRSDESKKSDRSSTPIKTEETSRRESQRNQFRMKQQAKLLAEQQLALKAQQRKDEKEKQLQLQRQQRLKQQREEQRREQQKALEKKQKQLQKLQKQQRVANQRANLPRSASSRSLTSKPTVLMNIKKSESTSSLQTSSSQQQEQKTSFLSVKFKRLKKANLSDQLKRSKDGKLDLMSPDSILTSVQIKDLLNERTFKLLPPAYQYQLLMLLPECDRSVGGDFALRLSKKAMNNAFFTRSCQEFKDKLIDGEFNTDIIQRAKNEVQINTKLDTWKAKFFEPVYGQSSLGNVNENDDGNKIDNGDKTDNEDNTKKDNKADTMNEVENKNNSVHLTPVQSSWVPFLKFAENSTDEFQDALQKIQAKIAEKKAREREEERLKEEQKLSRFQQKQKLILPNRKMKFISPSRSPTVRCSPVNLKPKTLRLGEIVSKEKSKKALKRAQILQRKKVIDKQLKDAKAKLVQEALSGARKDDLRSSPIKKENIPQKIKTASSVEKTDQITDSSLKTKKETDERTVHDNKEFLPIKKPSDSIKTELNHDSKVYTSITKPTEKSTTKRKTLKTLNSRIVFGPSTLGTSSDATCPCSMKAMKVCEQCGYFWHGDCMSGDNLCVTCAT